MTNSFQLIHSTQYLSNTPFLETGYAFTSQATSYYFNEATITRMWGIICNKDYEPMSLVHDEHIHWQPLLADKRDISLMPSQYEYDAEISRRQEWLGREAKNSVNGKRLEAADQSGATIYLMHCFMWYPYGHFFDSMQRILNIPKDIHLPSSRFLICDSTSRVSSFMDHMSAFGISTDQLQVIPRGYDSIRVSNLVVPNSVAEPSQYTNDSMTRIRELYLSSSSFLSMDKYFDAWASLHGKLALVLDRSSTGSRYIVNQDQIVSALEKKGYHCVILKGNEPFSLMLQLFSRASLVFSPHGSMMVNTIFCPEDCKVIEVIPRERVTLHFIRQCKPASHSAFIIASQESNSMSFDPEWLEEVI